MASNNNSGNSGSPAEARAPRAADAQIEQSMQELKLNPVAEVREVLWGPGDHEDTKVLLRPFRTRAELWSHISQLGLDFNRLSIEFTEDDGGDAASTAVKGARLLDSLQLLRRFLSIAKDPPILTVLRAGCMPHLINSMDGDNEKVAFEAAWCVTNLVSGDSATTLTVVEAGAVAPLVRMLSKDVACADQAVWALGNLAGDGVLMRDRLLKGGVLPKILRLIDPTDEKLNNVSIERLRNVMWSVSNFCRGKPIAHLDLIRCALPTIAHVMQSTDDLEALTDACWALSYIGSAPLSSDHPRITAVIDSGVVPKLVRLIGYRNDGLKASALRACGNLVTGEHYQTQHVLDCGILPMISGLMGHHKKSLLKEALWCLSNIAAGTTEHAQLLIDEPNLVKTVLTLLRATPHTEIRNEAAHVISNFLSAATNQQITWFMALDPLPGIFSMLKEHEARLPELATLALLQAVDSIFKSGKQVHLSLEYRALAEDCGGLDTIEALQHHRSDQIYEIANSIITSHFEGYRAPEQAEEETKRAD